MKIIRFGTFRSEKPGVELDSGLRKDCSAHFTDWDHNFFANDGLKQLARLLQSEADALPTVSPEVRLGAPIARPGKVLGIGLNYSDHAEEAGMPIPSEPILFMKASSTVIGPYDDIVIPRGSRKTDWEVELGVVIGTNAHYLPSPEAASAYIAGYCISHDVSEREFQLERGGQWTKGKSCDTFNPLGPILVTRDSMPEPHELSMSLDLNGERMQSGNTAKMIFRSDYLVYYLSQFMTLEAGDLITTGTPPGVGLGKKPPRFLRPGDIVELSIEGLGSQRQACRDATDVQR
jgi:2,4-didehydro-3-deoxy-L-rhamnonate hydrolase